MIWILTPELRLPVFVWETLQHQIVTSNLGDLFEHRFEGSRTLLLNGISEINWRSFMFKLLFEQWNKVQFSRLLCPTSLPFHNHLSPVVLLRSSQCWSSPVPRTTPHTICLHKQRALAGQYICAYRTEHFKQCTELLSTFLLLFVRRDMIPDLSPLHRNQVL